MKQKHNGGFSLIEVVVGMAILALIVLPTSTGMVMSFRMNAKTNEMLQAQLAVSSAVETLMAEGITEAKDNYGEGDNRFSEVTIKTTVEETYYEVVVFDGKVEDESLVKVTTHIRAATSSTPTETGE